MIWENIHAKALYGGVCLMWKHGVEETWRGRSSARSKEEKKRNIWYGSKLKRLLLWRGRLAGETGKRGYQTAAEEKLLRETYRQAQRKKKVKYVSENYILNIYI